MFIAGGNSSGGGGSDFNAVNKAGSVTGGNTSGVITVAPSATCFSDKSGPLQTTNEATRRISEQVKRSQHVCDYVAQVRVRSSISIYNACIA